jgi:hypothetical protein
VDLGTLHLLFEMAYHWSCQNDIPDGTEADNQEFHHLYEVSEEKNQGHPILGIVIVIFRK